MSGDFSLRSARKDDARALAELIDIAGEGFAIHLWSQAAGAGESALDVGMKRAQREEGGFSYRNAVVAETEGEIAGLLLGYRLADPYETGDLPALPEIVRPLVELEAHAPGSWYVNALAVYPHFRGRGLGGRLLSEAEAIARKADIRTLSLIVAGENAGAMRLYLRNGYRATARRTLVPFPGLGHGGEWVLMTRPV